MVIFMSNPTRIPIIVGGIVGVVALALCLFLPKDEQKDPSLQNTKPTTGIQIQVPTGPTDPTEIPPVIIIPGDDDPTTPTGPAGPTQPIPGNPVVEGSNEEDDIKDDEEIVIPDDEVIVIGKPEDEEPNVEQGEIRNDEVIKEKEENAPEEDDEHEDVIIVEDDKVSTGEEKGDVVEREPSAENDGEGNKNGPEYQPPAGGDNPFDDDTETEIEDTPVEDLIGDGEDRPGEGIHF